MIPKDFDNLTRDTAPFTMRLLDTWRRSVETAQADGMDRNTVIFEGIMFTHEAVAVLEEMLYKRGVKPAEVMQAFDEYCTLRLAEPDDNATVEELVNKSYGGTG